MGAISKKITCEKCNVDFLISVVGENYKELHKWLTKLKTCPVCCKKIK